MTALQDFTGCVIGDWTVQEFDIRQPGEKAKWKCKCGKCNKIKSVRHCHLKNGVSTKCRDCHNKTVNLKHGMSKTPIYAIWEAMLRRCTSKNDKSYFRYGGRGISVSKEWRDDFVNFFIDMGHRPKDLTLERVDNNSGYSKENCKWASRQDQLSNTRRYRREGSVYGCWRLIERIPYSQNSSFECIKCEKKRTSGTSYVTSGRCAACKCS